ncbi:MAG: hypothetical protein LBR91_03470 [Puniceicoccales bacterium]|jgi:hypothetical protein|nr:hypothetical protein [Puniceicoccales bacterium]
MCVVLAVKILKNCLLSQKFRKIADEIYEKFPFFAIEKSEFITRCLPLQRCGAGVILGYARENFDVRIINCDKTSDEFGTYENLPLGHFGEIVFSQKNASDSTHSGLYGFFDQRGRIWCCGKIAETISVDGKKYFPYCIEPLFERLWWVNRAKLGYTVTCNITPHIIIFPVKILQPVTKFFWKYFSKKLKKFSKKFKITSVMENFLLQN